MHPRLHGIVVGLEVDKPRNQPETLAKKTVGKLLEVWPVIYGKLIERT